MEKNQYKKHGDILLSVRHLNKKFCKDISHNMRYGIRDIWQAILPIKSDYATLREKEFWVLKDINFDLYEGEILGIVGANGSGKTSLMRIIGNIYTNDSGEVWTKEGVKTTAVFALRSGMQPLYTGRENIYLKGALFGMSKEKIDQRIQFIESFSELAEAIDQPLGNYSSGMAARLAYAIAIATDPNIFILDEALAVGDSVFKAKCFDHLKDWVQQPAKSVLFVSNNIRKILKVATRVLVIDKGRIVYDDSDVTAALNYYVMNCLKDLTPEEREIRFQKIQMYDY
ncbi:ABC transporter ATP-binding protein [Lewinella sp. LCG006]|uniref:ABC transporter ATP-binding protein n=1 Tax=Lewinella sp. LCG006 TaxID=3231911 RepID=UPI003461741A